MARSSRSERFVFVRDGFNVWAFLLTPLWLLRRRLWLVLLIYLVVTFGLELAMHYAGVGAAGRSLVMLLICFLGRTGGQHAAPFHAGATRMEKYRFGERHQHGGCGAAFLQ